MAYSFMDHDHLAGANCIFQISSLSLTKVQRRVGGAQPTLSAAEQLRYKARVLHEFDHLVRVLGTPYGLIRQGLMTHFLEYFIKAYRVRSGLDPLVKDWAKMTSVARPKMSDSEFHGLFHGDPSLSNLYRGQCMLSAVRALDGIGLDTMGIDSMAGWTQYVMSLMELDSSDSVLFNHYMQRLWGTESTGASLIHIDQKPVTSADVLEYLGIVVEAAYTVDMGGDHQFPPDLDPRVYLQVLNAVKQYLPEAFDFENEGMSQEIEAVMDLVFWVPLWPNMTEGDLLEHGIHYLPSFRLDKVLRAAKALSLPFSFEDNANVADIAPKAKAFQEAICRHLSWPTPTEIAENWCAALTNIETHSSQWHKTFFHHPGSRRLDWSRQLLREFADKPGAGPMLAGANHYGKINFLMIRGSDAYPDTFVPSGEIEWPEEDRHFQQLDLLLFTAPAYAITKRDWFWLPEPIREEAQETWKRLANAQMF